MPSRRAPPTKRAPRDEFLSSLQRPVAELCCVHPECADQGLAGLGNIVVRRGKGTGRWRMLRCRTCRREFSERKGTALWHSRMPPKKALDIAKHLAEGCGIRKTSRLVGASKTGVTNLAMRLGLHARALHDTRVRDVTVTEVQLDEKWAFVGKKQKHCDPADPADAERGDQWDHTAIDVQSRFVVSLEVGRRDRETVEATVADFANRTKGAPPR